MNVDAFMMTNGNSMFVVNSMEFEGRGSNTNFNNDKTLIIDLLYKGVLQHGYDYMKNYKLEKYILFGED